MSIKETAKQYSGYGLSVVLVPMDNTKGLEPKMPAHYWKELQREPLTPQEIEDLFSGKAIRPEIEREIEPKDKPPYFIKGIKLWGDIKGLGIITGQASGGLEVIDVDTKQDTTGLLWDEYRGLIEGSLPPEVYSSLVIAQTISGGYHIYYRCSQIAGNLKLASKPTQETLIETRGEGGLVVAPPTPGYKYLQGTPADIPTIAPEHRAVLLSIARGLTELPEEAPVSKPITSATDGHPPGLTPFEAYNLRGNIVALLESKDWTVIKQAGERVYLQRPLAPGEKASLTSGNYHTGHKTLRVWSTSTPFSSDKAYNPAQVFTILEYGADTEQNRKKAYGRLLELGYGEPFTKKEEGQVAIKIITVEAVNTITRETSVISSPGGALTMDAIQTAPGDELIITSPGPEATNEVLKAIALIEQAGKTPYIKQGPEPEIASYRYKLLAILTKYDSIQQAQGTLTDRDIKALEDEVVKTASALPPMERDRYKKLFTSLEAIQELGITPESYQIAVDRLTSTLDKEAQRVHYDRLLDEAIKYGKEGNIPQGIAELSKGLREVAVKDKRAIFSRLREIPKEEDLKKFYSLSSDNLRSGYYINSQELLLPSGALTGIAGATGHGKTDFLINLTLNSVKSYPGKEFYFFTYEMSQEAILVRFLNTYLDMDLGNGDNQRDIKRYFKTGSVEHLDKEARDEFIKKKERFFNELIYPGRLRVKGVDYLAPELNMAFTELSKGDKTGGYFIDYFQLLRLPKEGYKNYSRQEELKVICQDLNQTAIELQVPIILGAQFNREVNTPFKMHPTKIGEAGDIERILDTLIGIWYTSKKMVTEELTKAEGNDIQTKGLDIPGKLYTYVLKSRETPSDVWELMDYSGARGVIRNH